MLAWIHDDITWCMEEDCPMRDCMRNQVNMMDRTGLHSYAMFKGTSECPVSVGLDNCFDGCIHAKEVFADTKDPDDALRRLEDEYCDDCMFSSAEED